MKSLKTLSVFVAAILAIVTIVKAHNVTWGSIGPYDRFLAAENVVKPKSWFVKQTADVVYPPKGHYVPVTITAIRVWDWAGSKHPGYAALVKGGPGHRNATVHLKSKRGEGLNFTLQYFGH